MLPSGVEPLAEQPAELVVGGAVEATEDLDVLERQFKWRRLETDVTGRVREHEAEVDVNEVPVAVEEDVAVVSVFNLEQIRHEGITSKRFGEVALCPRKLC